MKDFNSPEAIILLLDSDSMMRGALRDVLQNAGYLVVVAGDVGKAVDRLREIRPDLLVTRPYINSMPGRLAADYLRTKAPGLAVLIVAGFMGDGDVEVQNSINSYFTFPEPFHAANLLARISEVLVSIRGA
jgi:DNA-binding response OmpR family regulator